MKQLPSNLTKYKTTPEFTELTVPKGLLKDHKTKEGVWGLIVVLEGRDLCNKPLFPKYSVENVLKSSFTLSKLLFCARFRLVLEKNRFIAKVSDHLEYTICEPATETVCLDVNNSGVVEQTILHNVKPLGKVRFIVEFYR